MTNNLIATLTAVSCGFAVLPAPQAAAGPQVCFRSSPSVPGRSTWIHECWSLAPLGWQKGVQYPEVIPHMAYSQGWALLMRQQPALFWQAVAGDGHITRKWRRFAAFQLLMGNARPGVRFARFAKLCGDLSWLGPGGIKPAVVPAPLSELKATAFRIRLPSPGEPDGEFLVAIAGRHPLSEIAEGLRGRNIRSLDRARVLAIGDRVLGPEWRFRRRPLREVRTFWLRAPKRDHENAQAGHTLDGWAIRHYVLPLSATSERRTAVLAALSLWSTPSSFWAGLARGRGSIKRPQRQFAEAMFLLTGVSPGETLKALSAQMRGFPRFSSMAGVARILGPQFLSPTKDGAKSPKSWISAIYGGAGGPVFAFSQTANAAVPYQILIPTAAPPGVVLRPGRTGPWKSAGKKPAKAVAAPRDRARFLVFELALSRRIRAAQLVSCLNGNCGRQIAADRIVELSPHWRPYHQGYVQRSLGHPRK